MFSADQAGKCIACLDECTDPLFVPGKLVHTNESSACCVTVCRGCAINCIDAFDPAKPSLMNCPACRGAISVARTRACNTAAGGGGSGLAGLDISSELNEAFGAIVPLLVGDGDGARVCNDCRYVITDDFGGKISNEMLLCICMRCYDIVARAWTEHARTRQDRNLIRRRCTDTITRMLSDNRSLPRQMSHRQHVILGVREQAQLLDADDPLRAMLHAMLMGRDPSTAGVVHHAGVHFLSGGPGAPEHHDAVHVTLARNPTADSALQRHFDRLMGLASTNAHRGGSNVPPAMHHTAPTNSITTRVVFRQSATRAVDARSVAHTMSRVIQAVLESHGPRERAVHAGSQELRAADAAGEDAGGRRASLENTWRNIRRRMGGLEAEADGMQQLPPFFSPGYGAHGTAAGATFPAAQPAPAPARRRGPAKRGGSAAAKRPAARKK